MSLMSRHALTTALSLTLALMVGGCAASGPSGGEATAFQLPAAQQAAPVQIATTDLAAIAPAAGGTVLMTRTETAATPAEQQDALRRLAEEVVSQHQQQILAAAAQQSQSVAQSVAAETTRQNNTQLTQSLNQLFGQLQAYSANNVSATAAQLRDYAYHVAGEAASQQASATEARISASTTAELAQLKLDNAKLQQQVGRQTQAASSVAVTEVAKLRAENAQLEAKLTQQNATTSAQVAQHTETELDRLRADNARLAAQLSQQQQSSQQATRDVLSAQVAALDKTTTGQVAALKDTTAAKLAAIDAKNNTQQQATRDVLSAQVAALDKTTTAQLGALDSKTTTQLVAMNDKTAAHFDTLNQTTNLKLAALDQKNQSANELTQTKLAALGQQNQANNALSDAKLAALNDKTNAQIAGLSQQQELTRQLAHLESQSVAKALHDYADQQLASAQAENKQNITRVAEAARLDSIDLEAATGRKLAEIQHQANAQAALLASKSAAQVEERVAAMEDQQLKPEQVRALAADVVSESTPQFRALALQSLAQSQDYIRTVAKDSLKDGDPAVQQALANAAQQVITKDDKVVFAIRQAVDNRLKEAALGSADAPSADAPKTVLGPDHGPEIRTTGDSSDDIAIEAARLLVKAPGEPDAGPAPVGVAPDGNKGALAMLNPRVSLGRVRNHADWVDLRHYRVVVHQDNQTLEDLMNGVLRNAEPYTGPWQVKWKLSPENKDVLSEKFSLDAETTFDEFINYISQYVMNQRGIKLTVNLFDTNHVLVISD